jgi:mannose-6-phosphate isomerase
VSSAVSPESERPFGGRVGRFFGEAERAWNFDRRRVFPVLISYRAEKIFGAGTSADAYAQAHEGGFGKTEVWYVLDAAEGASIRYGFTRTVTKEEIRQRIDAQTLDEVLRKIPVKRGDCIFVPPGTVHAIGAGILIAEVQQNSDATYRLFDYGRRTSKETYANFMWIRPLMWHFSNLSDPAPVEIQERNGYAISLLACPAFTSELVQIESFAELHCGTYSMVVAVVTGGSDGSFSRTGHTDRTGRWKSGKGTSVFLPAVREIFGLRENAKYF